MMSSQQIARLSDEAAARSERSNTRPKAFSNVGSIDDIRGVPFIGRYVAPGWRLIEHSELIVPADMREGRIEGTWATEPYLMVDSSGFGGRDEPALSAHEFMRLIADNPGVGWGIVEAGQFQVVVGAFKPVAGEKPPRVPRMNAEDLAAAFVAGKPGKAHNADTDGKRYRLHASDIAYKDGEYVVLDWCGHYTRTTAAHMNAILWALNAGQRVSYATDRDAGITTRTI
jgi:hypothetical protein